LVKILFKGGAMQDLENLSKKLKEIKKATEEKIPYPYERREFKIYLLRETGIDETEIKQQINFR
jgi:hypothetical protein